MTYYPYIILVVITKETKGHRILFNFMFTLKACSVFVCVRSLLLEMVYNMVEVTGSNYRISHDYVIRFNHVDDGVIVNMLSR